MASPPECPRCGNSGTDATHASPHLTPSALVEKLVAVKSESIRTLISPSFTLIPLEELEAWNFNDLFKSSVLNDSKILQ